MGVFRCTNPLYLICFSRWDENTSVRPEVQLFPSLSRSFHVAADSRISISFHFLFLSGYPIPVQAFATLPVSCSLCQRKPCLPAATISLLNSAQPPTQTIARRAENSLINTDGFLYLWLQQRLLEKIHFEVNQPGTSFEVNQPGTSLNA